MAYPFTLADTVFAVIPALAVQAVIVLFIFKKVGRKWMGYCIPVVLLIAAYLVIKGLYFV